MPIYFINLNSNAIKFYALDNLKYGDSVLCTGKNGSNLEFIYTTKKKIGNRWFINKTNIGEGPTFLFSEHLIPSTV